MPSQLTEMASSRRKFHLRHTSMPRHLQPMDQSRSSPMYSNRSRTRKFGHVPVTHSSPRRDIFVGNPLRVSLYRSTVEIDDQGNTLNLDVQKDTKKMYFIFFDNQTRCQREISIYLKQATQVLMYCHNDFRRMVAELLTIKFGKVTFKDLNQVLGRLAAQNAQIISQGILSQQQLSSGNMQTGSTQKVSANLIVQEQEVPHQQKPLLNKNL